MAAPGTPLAGASRPQSGSFRGPFAGPAQERYGSYLGKVAGPSCNEPIHVMIRTSNTLDSTAVHAFKLIKV